MEITDRTRGTKPHTKWVLSLASARSAAPPRSISPDELALHGPKAPDVWMALHGNVYDVTPYLDYHPGGRAQLLRGAGTDASALFRTVHNWVNWSALLGSCLIGTLGPSPTGIGGAAAAAPNNISNCAGLAPTIVGALADSATVRATLLWRHTRTASTQLFRFELPRRMSLLGSLLSDVSVFGCAIEISADGDGEWTLAYPTNPGSAGYFECHVVIVDADADHSQPLWRLKPGDTVLVRGPFGTANARPVGTHRRLACVADMENAPSPAAKLAALAKCGLLGLSSSRAAAWPSWSPSGSPCVSALARVECICAVVEGIRGIDTLIPLLRLHRRNDVLSVGVTAATISNTASTATSSSSSTTTVASISSAKNSASRTFFVVWTLAVSSLSSSSSASCVAYATELVRECAGVCITILLPPLVGASASSTALAMSSPISALDVTGTTGGTGPTDACDDVRVVSNALFSTSLLHALTAPANDSVSSPLRCWWPQPTAETLFLTAGSREFVEAGDAAARSLYFLADNIAAVVL